MRTEEQSNERKRRIALRAGIVLAFLFALTWSFPSFLNWTLLLAAGYCFFLYWFYQPKAEMFQRTGEFEFRSVNPAQRMDALFRRVVRIVSLSVAGLFVVFLVLRTFSGGDQELTPANFDEEETERPEDDDVTALNERGYNFYLNKQYDSAIYYYDRALGLEPDNGAVWLNRGLVYYDQEKTDKAIEAFSRSYDAGVRDAFLSHVLAYLYDNGGNTTRALSFYKEAVGMDSSRSDIYSRLAELEPANAARYKALEEKYRN